MRSNCCCDGSALPLPLALSDSHIAEPELITVFDGVEFLQSDAHDLGTRFSVVAVPGTEAGDDPGGVGERTFGMRIFLTLGFAFELGRDGFHEGLRSEG